MDVVKVYQESIPAVKLIGKRYDNRDRDLSGSFSGQWQQWFSRGWFELMRECEWIPGISEDYLGVMRMAGDGSGFEYWIGSFFASDASVPEGFESVEIPAGEIGVCWLRGNEQSGELYGHEASDLSMKALSDEGLKFSERSWFLERYNCPRFTEPDEDGNVILDICVYLV